MTQKIDRAAKRPVNEAKKFRTDILILGAGIGGYDCFRTLARLLKRKGLNKQITIVDKNNYFTFIPMLHESAAGSIEPNHCAVPLRELVVKTPHRFLRALVFSIDPKKRIAATSEGSISYDYCVVALGSTVQYFGIPGAEEYTYYVRHLVGAMRLHHDIVNLIEDPDTRDLRMTVVGGGYTGVEVAGQFSDLLNKDIRTLYPHIHTRVSLIESNDLVLQFAREHIRRRVTKKIQDMGVKTYLKSRVKRVEKDAVILEDGRRIPSDMVIWATGFKNIADSFLPASCTAEGRIPTTPFLSSLSNDTLYAIGDIMCGKDPTTDLPYPQLAEAAHQEGQYVARHIARRIQGKTSRPFVFRSKGSLMPVGDWWGVLVVKILGKELTLFGPIAWWIRRTVYLLFMPGLIRKLKIVIDWTLHGFGFRFLLDTQSNTRERGTRD